MRKQKSHVDWSYSPDLRLATEGMDTAEPTLPNILKELRDFRKDNNQQQADIKRELRGVDARVEEAETDQRDWDGATGGIVIK